MASRQVFRRYVIEALRELDGAAPALEVTKWIWQVHEEDLRRSGDLFFTWQYDVRWAAQHLRNVGLLMRVDGDRRAPWELTQEGWAVEVDSLG